MTAICAVFGIYVYLLRSTARRNLFVYLLLHKVGKKNESKVRVRAEAEAVISLVRITQIIQIYLKLVYIVR